MQIQEVLIAVTPQDIEGADRFGLQDPLLHALQRTTGTLWRLSGPGIALEIMPPYRGLFLPEEALRHWRVFKASGAMEPFEFMAEFRVPNPEKHVTNQREGDSSP